MISLNYRNEGNEELNLDVNGSLDTPVYRDAYRELIKCRDTKNVSYEQFLSRMKARNIASRKKEKEKRSIIISESNAPLAYRAFIEMKASSDAKTAGSPV